MKFRSVFISVFIGTAMIVSALIINARRPEVETAQPTAAHVRATGKCAECHRLETAAILHQFESSQHAAVGVTCLDCHMPQDNQEIVDHRGFTIAKELTSQNCAGCHTTEYRQFLRSRHAAPSWAAVTGAADFSEEQIAAAEAIHPGSIRRKANVLAIAQGAGVLNRGCMACHEIGKPNADGSIGTCTQCHARHASSIALAREPQTCGQCHMGPDHAQLEIYNESKHGVIYNSQKRWMNLAADPKRLSVRDMPVPTCSTCHMSGLDGLKVTHDTTERLSYWLFAPVSEKRPTYAQGQTQMQEVCLKCHAAGQVKELYREAEIVIAATNEKVSASQRLMAELRAEGLLTPEPFDESIEFIAFDLWHYYGRTAKHGAFMGGADFVQWHGNYELLLKMVEMEEIAKELRAGRRIHAQ